MRSIVALAALLMALEPKRCAGVHQDGAHAMGSVPQSAGEIPRPGPIRMETLDEAQTPPVFVMRGEPHGREPIVVLHGMCSHALGYAQSFQFNAARKGFLVAPQGDEPCGGPWASWSRNLDGLDGRIGSAVRAITDAGATEEVVVIGYSQGATRAEQLARRFPERYTRVILIASPGLPHPYGLTHLRGAVMMAGERDRQDLMKAAAASFRAAGIPTTFQVIPSAKHGEMGPHPEETMGLALDWLWANAKPPASDP